MPRRLLWHCGSYRNHTEQNNDSSEDSLHNLCIYSTVQPFAKQSVFPCIASNCASVDIKNFWLLDCKFIKNISLLFSSTSGSRGRGGPGAVLCHFEFSKLLNYILLSADVTVAGRSELLFCHHLCLFERCCITYFLHWPTATLRIATSARLHHHSHSLLPDFAVVCLQLAARPKSDCHLAPAPWRWLIVVNAAVWRMGGADSINTHTHADMQCVSDLCLSGSVCWAWWNLWSREG